MFILPICKYKSYISSWICWNKLFSDIFAGLYGVFSKLFFTHMLVKRYWVLLKTVFDPPLSQKVF